MDFLIHIEFPNIELSTFKFRGMKTAFTKADMGLSKKHKNGCWKHFGSV